MRTLPKLAVVKALVFVIVGILAAVVVSNTLRVPVPGATTSYRIQFTDAEGLVPGNPVNMAGVRIGRVDSIALRPQPDGTSLAEVDVEIERDHRIPEQVHAAVRYADMLGARYIALSHGPAGHPVRDGNRIPFTATSAPVNLTAIMNGFEPLFSALEPGQVNELARGFVDTFSGRSGSVQMLLEQIATMGENLSSTSVVFTRLVANLNLVLDTVGQYSPELSQLFDGLSDLTSSIIGDNGELAALLDSGDKALGALASMMTAAGDDFEKSLVSLEQVTGSWVPNTEAFTTFLHRMPELADQINHSGRYGGFMMLYLCNFTLKAFDAEANIFGPLNSPVCM